MLYNYMVLILSILVSSSPNYVNVKHRKRPIKDPYCISYGAYTYDAGIKTHTWDNYTKYSIGKFCSIADNLTIFLGGNHRIDWISTFPHTNNNYNSKGNIIIGNDVWIGSHVTILSGVTIGDGAVVGAYSVVTKNVAPYSIVAGNPIKLIRYRFTPDEIQQLLNIKWWDWPIAKIKQNAHLLGSSNLREFIDLNY